MEGTYVRDVGDVFLEYRGKRFLKRESDRRKKTLGLFNAEW
jgi:hypothetical protein